MHNVYCCITYNSQGVEECLVSINTRIKKISVGVCRYICVSVCVCARARAHVCSIVSGSLQFHELQPTRLLCPWNFPDKNTRVGCHFLLQGVFLIQALNPHLPPLLHWQVDSLPLYHLESVYICVYVYIYIYICHINI